ncbi:MAG: peptide chain release factor 1 [Alphaproteobacteria bacterium]|nr:peptide chain release factor 1 [Alphaproteobacteria bacterium]
MSLINKLDGILAKFNDLENKLQDPSGLGQNFAKISKEHSDMQEVVAVIQQFQTVQKEFNDIEQMLADSNLDKEMRDMMEEEKFNLSKKIPELEQQIKIALLPKDSADEKNAIIEVRAGTGGEEAALFAYKLFHMYHRYAEKNRWKFEVLSISDTGLGGYKEASAIISGRGVFARLKFESGGHRVQRVPETESAGRVHTSAATVAVLPEAEEVDIKIEEKDLRIDVFRSSGPGGQSVNTTDSAVRITHIPTGVVVSMQDEKSQIKNREKAMKVLRSRIYEAERERLEKERAMERKEQVGSGDRSERIRTYNFPQSRVTDHRINLTSYRIDDIMMGEIDEFVNALIAYDQAKKLSQE